MTRDETPEPTGEGAPRTAGSPRRPEIGPPRSAVSDATALLARRPLTTRELRQRLSRRGHPEGHTEAAVERMLAARYLDDATLALDYIVVRSRRKSHGRGRLLLELERRGVAPDVARGAWALAIEQGEIDPGELLASRLEKELRRVETPLDQRGYRRVYNALLRSGFEMPAVVAALAPHHPKGPKGPKAATEGRA